MIHLIERFTDHLKKGRYNNATIKSYRAAVFLFYNKYRDYPQHKIDSQLVSEYLQEFKDKKADNPEVVIQNGKAIKLFFKVIFDKSLDLKSTGDKKQQAPYILSRAEIRRIISTVNHPKHQLIIQLSYGLGLKLNELVNLRISSIDFEKSLITIGDDPADGHRTLLIPVDLLEKLSEYIRTPAVNSEYLFSNKAGQKISPRGVQLYFTKVIEELNIDKSVTLQNLRHSYAVHLLDRGIDLHHLQRALGHKYLQTTSMYQSYTNFDLQKLESPLTDLF